MPSRRLSPDQSLAVELHAATIRKLREGQAFEEVVEWARELAGGNTDALIEQAVSHVAGWMGSGEPVKLVAAAVLATAGGGCFPGEDVLAAYGRIRSSRS